MRRYYLEDEYYTGNGKRNEEGPCTCVQKYGKCSCDKPLKQKPTKRKQQEKPARKQAPLILSPYNPSGGCGSCGTNDNQNIHEQRACHSTPPPVLQPLSATPVSDKKYMSTYSSPMPSQRDNLPFYSQDVPTRERTSNPVHPVKTCHNPMDQGHYNKLDTATTQTKDTRIGMETLNVQFPCPCASGTMHSGNRTTVGEMQFYKWWEDILRKHIEKEGKRFSEEFPLLMANYYSYEKDRQNVQRSSPDRQSGQSQHLQQQHRENRPQRHQGQERHSTLSHESQARSQQARVSHDRHSQQSHHSQPHNYDQNRLQRYHQQEPRHSGLSTHSQRPDYRHSQQPRHSQQSHQSQQPRHSIISHQSQQPRHSQQSHQSQQPRHSIISNHSQQQRHSQLSNQSQQQRHSQLSNQSQQQRHLHQPRPSQTYYQDELPRQEPELRSVPQYCGQQEVQPQYGASEYHENCCSGPVGEIPSDSAHPKVKQTKWSFMETLRTALKVITGKDKKPPDGSGACQCGQKLDICGPYNKPCHGLEGIIMPCGYECECGPEKKCLLPYLNELCPCGQTCQCAKEGPTERSSHVSHLIATQRSTPLRETTSLPMFIAEDPRGNDCACGEYVPGIGSKQGDCCCSCDEEMCPCCCCCCLDISQKRVQTSGFFLREKCTQTDKTPKKCCRCCRCCSSRGKKQCSMCMKSSKEMFFNNNGNDPGNSGGGHCPRFKDTNNLLSKSYIQTDDHIYLRPHSTSAGGPPVQQYHPEQYHQHTYYQRVNGQVPTSTFKTKGKTTMVRTNSIQCIPAQENKSTSCTYDETITSKSRFENFLSQLNNGSNFELNEALFGESGDSDVKQNLRKTPITLDAGDVNRLTKAKLRNCFLEGDVYSSPISGRTYDLSYRTIDMPSKLIDTTLMKPLDINDELQFSKLPPQCFATEVEHTKLMTAVCEAILSSNQESKEVDEPIKEVKVQVAEEVDLVQQKIEILQTIKEDSESLRSNQDNADDGSVKLEDKRHEKMIFEVQQNFKTKIERLENKIDRLMMGENAVAEADKIKTKPKIKEQSRSRSTSPKSQQKKIMEHKPLITKTGLFGVIPTRSQLFGNDFSTGAHHLASDAHQKGDAKSENHKKHADDSITKYEDLVMTNQKHVDELLVQLETLHSCNKLLDKNAIAECNRNAICCFETKEELIYKPNLGTGETILPETYHASSRNLLGQLEDLLTGNAQGEKLFSTEQSPNDNDLGPSTSSARETGIVDADTECLEGEQSVHLDFSSIVFKKFATAEEESDRAEDLSVATPTADHNFILRNLPSIVTSVSDSFMVEKILRDEDTVLVLDSSKADSFDEFLTRTSGTTVIDDDINSKNKS